MAYDLKPIELPRVAGLPLRALIALLEFPLTRDLAASQVLKSGEIDRLHTVTTDEPLPAVHPLLTAPLPSSSGTLPPLETLLALPGPGGFAFETTADFTRAYREGRVTPSQVAERLLSAVREDEAQSPAMRIFIAQRADDVRAQAEAATARWAAGTPLGPLDGVPVAVKDEMDQRGYPTTVGTRFLGTQPAGGDATVVARLRAAGALLTGKANMHEIGIGVTGLNLHHGACRNPYDPDCAPGGSSSGSAAAVAAGYGPIAVGADGGGSIRIPAALCGMVGLKPTYGRLSAFGSAPLCWSVGALGPIAATARDAAIAYAVMAGPDPRDPVSGRQPAPDLDQVALGHLRGVRLGIYRAWFEDADAEVVAACRTLLDGLVAAGATLVEIEIPELGLVGPAHSVTIISEMATAHHGYYAKHRAAYGPDVRINLALARHLRATDYAQAQRHRARIFRHFTQALSACDAIVTPSTGCAAPRFMADALVGGESDLVTLDCIMRFARAANLTGLPAVSVPAGYTAAGLPIGFQAMGRPWEESLLLRLALVADGLVARRSPRIHHTLLSGV